MQIQMPVGALASILHRVTGVLLAIAVPLGVYLLHLSLHDEQSFSAVTGLFSNGAFKALLVVLIWALAHHVLAGIRHLLTDANTGSTLHVARRSAWGVNIGGVGVALFAAAALW